MGDLVRAVGLLGVSALCILIGFNRHVRTFVMRNTHAGGSVRPLYDDEEGTAVWGVILLVAGLTSLICGLAFLISFVVKLLR